MSISAFDLREPARDALSAGSDPVRVLVIPGLHGSGPTHWQTWLQARVRHATRVEQDDWDLPDITRWSQRIDAVVATRPGARWVAVAHSFGCLALAHHLGRRHAAGGDEDDGVAAALFVAPAEPLRFRLADVLPHAPLGIPCALIASDTDPWMAADSACRWARRWDAAFVNLGDAGHINADAGFGPFPRALQMTQALLRRVERRRCSQTA